MLARGGIDRLALGEALPPDLGGSIAFSTGAVLWRDRTFRRVAFDLGLDGQGMVDVERATAVLPRPSYVVFSGRSGPLGSTARPTAQRGRTGAGPELIAAFAEPPALIRRSSTLTLVTDLD